MSIRRTDAHYEARPTPTAQPRSSARSLERVLSVGTGTRNVSNRFNVLCSMSSISAPASSSGQRRPPQPGSSSRPGSSNDASSTDGADMEVDDEAPANKFDLDGLPTSIKDIIFKMAVDGEDPCERISELCNNFAFLDCKRETFWDEVNQRAGWYGPFTAGGWRAVVQARRQNQVKYMEESEDGYGVRLRIVSNDADELSVIPTSPSTYFRYMCSKFRMLKYWNYDVGVLSRINLENNYGFRLPNVVLVPFRVECMVECLQRDIFVLRPRGYYAQETSPADIRRFTMAAIRGGQAATAFFYNDIINLEFLSDADFVLEASQYDKSIFRNMSTDLKLDIAFWRRAVRLDPSNLRYVNPPVASDMELLQDAATSSAQGAVYALYQALSIRNIALVRWVLDVTPITFDPLNSRVSQDVLIPVSVFYDAVWRVNNMQDMQAKLNMLRLLIERGGNVNDVNADDGNTVLHRAVEMADSDRNAETFALLLDAGADIDAVNNEGKTPLMVWVEEKLEGNTNDFIECLDLFLARNPRMEVVTNLNEHDVLMLACKNRALQLNPGVLEQVVDKLIAAGANVQAVSWRDETALILAIQYENYDTARRLVQVHGASVNPVDIRPVETSALYAAVEQKNVPMATFLLDNGANINTQLASPHYLLRKAANQHDLDMIRLLVNRGANVNQRFLWGSTALHVLAAARGVEVADSIRFLLSQGADVNARDDDANTPLMIAVFLYRDDAVRAILEFNPDLSLRNRLDETAEELARENAERNDNPDTQDIYKAIRDAASGGEPDPILNPN